MTTSLYRGMRSRATALAKRALTSIDTRTGSRIMDRLRPPKPVKQLSPEEIRAKEGRDFVRRIEKSLTGGARGLAILSDAADYTASADAQPDCLLRLMRVMTGSRKRAIIGLVYCDVYLEATKDGPARNRDECNAAAAGLLLGLTASEASEARKSRSLSLSKAIAQIAKTHPKMELGWSTAAALQLAARSGDDAGSPLQKLLASRRSGVVALAAPLTLMLQRNRDAAIPLLSTLAANVRVNDGLKVLTRLLELGALEAASELAVRAIRSLHASDPALVFRFARPFFKRDPTSPQSLRVGLEYIIAFGTSADHSKRLLQYLTSARSQSLLQDLILDDEVQTARALSAEGANEVPHDKILANAPELRSRLAKIARIRAAFRIEPVKLLEAVSRSGDLFQLERTSRGNFNVGTVTVPATLKGEVVILAEAGTDLTDIDQNPRFANAKLTVYSSEDVSNQFINLRPDLGSFRDKVPDHTPLSHDIYKEAKSFSRHISNSLFRVMGEKWQPRYLPYLDAVELTVEDACAVNLTLMECFLACVEEHSNASSFVLVFSTGDLLGNLLPRIMARVPDGRIYGCVATSSSHRKTALRRIASQFFYPEARVREPNALCDAPSPIFSQSSQWDAVDEAIGAAVKAEAHALTGNFTLLGSNLRQPNYRDTILNVIKPFLREGQPLAIYDVANAAFDADGEVESFAALRDPLIQLIDLRYMRGVARSAWGGEGWLPLLPVIDIKGYRPVVYDDALRPSLEAVARRLLRNALPELFLSIAYWDQFFQVAAASRFIASSTRMVGLRVAAIAAKLNDVPVIDIQTLNILPHPRYKAPVCDQAFVIDDLSEQIYVSSLRFPRDRISPTGTPRIDRIRDDTLSLDKAKVEEAIGLTPDARPRILFASQLQPLERCESILRQLCRAAIATGAELIVKMHPREGEARIQLYRQVITEEGARRICFLVHQVPIQEVLAVSDVTVTMFSNVAREALMVGHDVIVANYFSTELPLRFDDEGIARGAYSEKELFDLVVEALEQRKATTGDIDRQASTPTNAYLTRNPHLIEGQSGKRIFNRAQAFARRIEVGERGFPRLDEGEVLHAPTAALTSLLGSSLDRPDDEQAQSFEQMVLSNADAIIRAHGVPVSRIDADTPPGAAARTCTFINRFVAAATDPEAAATAGQAFAGIAAAEHRSVVALMEDIAAGQSVAAAVFAGEFLAASCQPLKAASLFRRAAELCDNADVAAQYGALAFNLAPRRARCAMKPGDPLYRKSAYDAETYDPPSRGAELDRRLTLVVERGIDPRSVKEAVSQYPIAYIFAEDPKSTSLVADPAVQKRYFRETSEDQSPDFAKLIATIPEAFARDFYAALVKTLGSGELGRFAQRHQPAITAWMRAALIDPARRTYECKRASAHAGDEVLLVLGSTPAFIQEFRAILDHACFVYAGPNAPSRKLWADELDDIEQDVSHPSVEFDEVARTVQTVERELYASPSISLAGPATRRVLAVCRWSLKTVPATLTPIVAAMPDDISVTIVDFAPVDKIGNLVETVRSLNRSRRGNEIRFVPMARMRKTFALPKASQEIAAAIWHECGSSPALRALGLDIRSIARKRVTSFAQDVLHTMAQFERSVREFLEADGEAVVAVSPGRHAEAMLAQDTARLCGKRSVDIQNAYMSAGYTYTKPHGDVVTAIDQWSVDLFVNHFKMAPEVVRKVGTPRFDTIPNAVAEIGESKDAASRLGFTDPQRPLVCFATQPGQSKTNLTLTQLLDSIADLSPANVVVKLHPNDPDREETYRGLMPELVRVGRGAAVREFPIYPIIATSAVVVTMFSNVGIEAAIAGKDLIVVNFDGAPMPLPLDEFNIGVNVGSAEEFIEAIINMTGDDRDSLQLQSKRRKYFSDNKHLLLGNATREICKIIVENMR